MLRQVFDKSNRRPAVSENNTVHIFPEIKKRQKQPMRGEILLGYVYIRRNYECFSFEVHLPLAVSTNKISNLHQEEEYVSSVPPYLLRARWRSHRPHPSWRKGGSCTPWPFRHLWLCRSQESQLVQRPKSSQISAS